MELTPLPWRAQDAQPFVASLATPRAKTIAVHASNQLSVWCAAEQKMTIPVLGHPFGTSQVTLPGPLGAFGLALRIDVQKHLCDFAPICPSASASKRSKYVTRCCSSYPVRMGSVGAVSDTGGSSGVLAMVSLSQSSICTIAYHRRTDEAR